MKLLSESPVDAAAAETNLRIANEHARRSGDALWEIQALNITAQAAVRLQSDAAVDHCRAVLDRAYDTRFWVVVGQAAPMALAALEAAGHRDAATTIAGALERHFAVTNPIAREICDQHVERARHHEHSARLIARGAAMDRDEMRRFILDELAAASEHTPNRR